MSIYTKALNESFTIEEDALLMTKSSLNESVEDSEIISEDIQEEPVKEENNKSIEEALDMYESLLKQDIPPKVAKAKVLGKDPEPMKEGLEEKKSLTRKERLEEERKERWRGYCETFRKEENFAPNEELTEETLKYSGPAIKRLATRYGIPSAKLKEALIKGIE